MHVMVKVTVPNYIYRFYTEAARQVANCTPEAIMSDALSAYAGLLSPEISKIRELSQSESGEACAESAV